MNVEPLILNFFAQESFFWRVLNLYGDYENGGDQRVSITSSKTLKYIVLPNAKSYQEKKFTGRNAQHSRLHSNPEVDRALVNFLWK